MLAASGMDKDAVLTFGSQEEYEQYLADTEMLKSADEMPDADDLAEAAHGNGHEMHPEGDVLDALHEDSLLPDAKPDLPMPDTPVSDIPDAPDLPTPPRGARR